MLLFLAALFLVVLVGTLSNPEFEALLQSLTSRNQHKVARPHRARAGPSSDGRRRFGTLSTAIVEVLTRNRSDMRVREIHASVEHLLGEPVSYVSIKSYLHKGAQGQDPRFGRVSRGRYELFRRPGSPRGAGASRRASSHR